MSVTAASTSSASPPSVHEQSVSSSEDEEDDDDGQPTIRQDNAAFTIICNQEEKIKELQAKKDELQELVDQYDDGQPTFAQDNAAFDEICGLSEENAVLREMLARVCNQPRRPSSDNAPVLRRPQDFGRGNLRRQWERVRDLVQPSAGHPGTQEEATQLSQLPHHLTRDDERVHPSRRPLIRM